MGKNAKLGGIAAPDWAKGGEDSFFGEAGETIDSTAKGLEIIEEIAILEGEIALLREQVNEHYKAAEEYGCNVAAMRLVLQRRRKTQYERDDMDTCVAVLEEALKDREGFSAEEDDII